MSTFRVARLRLEAPTARIVAAASFYETAARAAGLAVSVGATPLPTRLRRVTIPRSVFKHKTAQESWQHSTHRRLLEIRGTPKAMSQFLAFASRARPSGVALSLKVEHHSPIAHLMHVPAALQAAQSRTI
uniref:Small ribosomal subunit protein uS10 domain-containing protein n=1 Tax=Sexangularia sp. CB-2014 TaxID=1486929 RepID=A0A7S1YCF7_9EUKA|mmetsp:Transcript_13150/g.41452  ORF Transcript_13150/g.41452 Transcript_13150/m.41452 type:complete len:130 (+) Transcript_13150:238-627(+)